MKRRTTIKSLLAAPFVGLPQLQAKQEIILPHQQIALDAIKKHRTCLFIWPRGSSKTWTLAKSLGMEQKDFYKKEFYIHNDPIMFCYDDPTYPLHYQCLEHELKSTSKVVVFVTPTEANNDWLLENKEKFDFVDWRSINGVDSRLWKENSISNMAPNFYREYGCNLYAKTDDPYWTEIIHIPDCFMKEYLT